ncbi:interleukin-9 [Ursus americanus]|uniref:interleukin-9 n=1 Tax=Ursus americanus TaxID=9643 RepID=UPI001E679C0F|nr:interleukin-9 [Ursus americanus]
MTLPTVVLASVLFLCSATSQKCTTFTEILDVTYLIDKLQDNCTTVCFQEGLSQMTNSTAETRYPLIFNRVKKTVLKNKCQLFSCEQPCNQTTTGNTLTFLQRLREVLQKQRAMDKV